MDIKQSKSMFIGSPLPRTVDDLVYASQNRNTLYPIVELTKRSTGHTGLG